MQPQIKVEVQGRRYQSRATRHVSRAAFRKGGAPLGRTGRFGRMATIGDARLLYEAHAKYSPTRSSSKKKIAQSHSPIWILSVC